MMYDVLILGMGEAACAAALAAAQRNQRVAIVDRPTAVDQRAVEGLVDLASALDVLRVESVCAFSVGGGPAQRTSGVADLWSELSERVTSHRATTVEDLSRHGVDCLTGRVRFESSHEVVIENGGMPALLSADRIVVATGKRSVCPSHLVFDGQRVLTVEDVPDLVRIPERLAVVVDDVSGVECVSLLCRLGAQVTVVGEAVDEFSERDMRRIDSRLTSVGLERPQWRVRAAVMDVERDNHDRAVLLLSDGTRLEQDAVLYCGRVCGNTDALNLSAAGLEVDDRGQLWCNERFQTWIPHIFGLGEVIGYPSAAGQLSGRGALFVDALLDVDATEAERGFACGLPERSLALV